MKPLRVLGVIPGKDEATSMWFARRQMATVADSGIVTSSFYLRSRTSPLQVFRELRRLRKDIRKFSPDVIHAHFGTMTAFVAAIATRLPLVITFHGSDLNPAPGTPWIRSLLGRALSHLAIMRAAQVVCVSEQLRGRIGYRKSGVHVVPCGIDLQRFRPMCRSTCRAKLGWAADEQVILFNARDPIGKRLDLAKAACEHARATFPNLRMHVFRGTTHPDEMPVFYSSADCQLLTSDYEGSPMVIKEALACNLPIVSVDVGDVAERLAGVTPAAVVERDASALGDALVCVLRTFQRSNGREAVRVLSEETVANEVARIYYLAAGKVPLEITAAEAMTNHGEEAKIARVA